MLHGVRFLSLFLLCYAGHATAAPRACGLPDAPFSVERMPNESGAAPQVLLRGLPLNHNYQRGDYVLLRAPVSHSRDAISVGLATIVEPMSQTAKAVIEFVDPAAKELCAGPISEKVQIGKEVGTVLSRTADGRVKLNIGASDGVLVGDSYQVLGMVVSDADLCGRSLGREPIGSVKVTDVGGFYAWALLIDGQASAGNFVRRVAPDPQSAGREQGPASRVRRSLSSSTPLLAQEQSSTASVAKRTDGLKEVVLSASLPPPRRAFPKIGLSIGGGAGLLAILGGVTVGVASARFNELMATCQPTCTDEQTQSVRMPLNTGYALFGLAAAAAVTAGLVIPFEMGLLRKSSETAHKVVGGQENLVGSASGHRPNSEGSSHVKTEGQTAAPHEQNLTVKSARLGPEPSLAGVADLPSVPGYRVQPETSASTGRRPFAPMMGLIGAGAATLAIGIACGGAAISAADTVASVSNNGNPFSAELYGIQERGKQLNGAAIALDVIGGIALAGGGTWLGFWLHRRSHMRREESSTKLLPTGTGLAMLGEF